jgi:hypothetical protein
VRADAYDAPVTAERVWTNSAYGRFLCTAFAVVMPLASIGGALEDGAVQPGTTWFIVSVVLCALISLAVVVASWTSRLVLADGVLTATNFGVSRSMPLKDVVEVDPSAFPFLGMKIRRHDKAGLRTLVSGSLNRPRGRAERIAEEITDLAAAARAAAVAAGERVVVPEKSEWSTWQYLAASSVVLCLGIGALTYGVLALREPLTLANLHALLGLAYGPMLILFAALCFWATLDSSDES